MTKEKENKNLKELKKCFFITPIGSQGSDTYKKLSGITKNVIEPVLKKYGYELIVAHTIQKLGSINDQIFRHILESDLIISNLTGLNPNVMYETAVAHSFGKPTIMVSEHDTTLPFDLTTDRTIFFEDSISGAGELITELSKKIEELHVDKDTDNPVVRVIEASHLKESLKGDNLTENQTILKMLYQLERKVDNISLNDNAHNFGSQIKCIAHVDIPNKNLDEVNLNVSLLSKHNIFEDIKLLYIEELLGDRSRVKLGITIYEDDFGLTGKLLKETFDDSVNISINRISA
ncbi:MAG: hypothetical protein LBE23_02675 [Vagococcus sp.]|jgi:hypothetical protein|nr:hypothetical protein [Vagococcus sp.]